MPHRSPGVLRNIGFVRYLQEIGHTVFLLVPKHSDCIIDDPDHVWRVNNPACDKGFDFFSGIPVRQRFSKLPYRLMQKIGMAPGSSHTHVPDPTMHWVKNAVSVAKKISEEHPIDIIYSSSPAISSHFIARKIKIHLGCLWIAEYRDTWSQCEYDNTKRNRAWKIIDKSIERCIIELADYLVGVSPSQCVQLSSLHNKECILVTNGYEIDNYPVQTTQSEKFIIRYVGSMNSKQNVSIFFKAFRQYVDDHELTADDISIEFIGRRQSGLLESDIVCYNLQRYVSLMSEVSYEESFESMRNATLLLFFQYMTADTEGVYTSKIFYYMGSRRPIIAIGKKNHSTAKLISYTNAGFTGETCAEIYSLIKYYYDQWKVNGKWLPDNDSHRIEEYERRNQYSQIIKLFNKSKLM